MQIAERFQGAVQVAEQGERFAFGAASGLRGDGAQEPGYAGRLRCGGVLAAKKLEDLLLEVGDRQAAAEAAGATGAADEDVPLREPRPFAEQLDGLESRVAHRFAL